MNKVILMGRLTRDPEIRYSKGESSTAVARYTLAVDRRFKREGEASADFLSCVAFGRQAEFAEKYLHQGTKIVVCGRIQIDNYTNKEGKKASSTDIIVEDQEFAESKKSNQVTHADKPSTSNASAGGDDFLQIPEGSEENGLFG